MHMTTVSTEAERAARMRDFAELDRQREKDEERKRKNPPFVQLTESRMSDLRKHLRHNPLAVEIFLFLSQHMDQSNIVICPMKVLQEEMQKGRTSCSTAIRYLKGAGLIEVVKFSGANGFALNGEYVWKAAHHEGRYSVFQNVKALAAHSDNAAIRKKLAHIFQPSLPGFDQDKPEDEDSV